MRLDKNRSKYTKTLVVAQFASNSLVIDELILKCRLVYLAAMGNAINETHKA